jgi:hypothetical protein
MAALAAIADPAHAFPAEVTLRLPGKKPLVRPVVDLRRNRFRPNYWELEIAGMAGRWVVQHDINPFEPRSKREMAFFHTSNDLGLGVVSRVLEGTWAGREGSFQRVVPDAQRSTGAVGHDLRAVGALDVDWDSLHAVAIQHFVTSLMDDHAGNLLISRTANGLLRYHAIDADASFGFIGNAKWNTARELVRQGPRDLSPALWDRIRKADIPRWLQHLHENGLRPDQINEALRRLQLVQEHGLAVIL